LPISSAALMNLGSILLRMKYKSPPVIADPPDDVIAIRSLLDRLRETWAAGDALGYADCFTEESDYVTYSGMHLRGRKENAEVHGSLFRGVLKGTRLSTVMESLVFLSTDVALIHTVGSGAQRGRERSPSRKSIQTMVAVKRDQRWRIRSFQNTRIRAWSIWLTRMATRR
jgi:uncharacterized protein (TIGR02246 family)